LILGILYYAINGNLKLVSFACISNTKIIKALLKSFEITNKEGKIY